MKKVLTILFLIMLIISLFQIANTYALYKSQLQGEYMNLLGVWAIKVNGVDISSGDENLKFTMTEDNLIYLNSAHVKNQRIAPGTQACFEIIIDPTSTDVSILYTLDLKVDDVTTAKLKLVKVENYFQKTGETQQIENKEVYTQNEKHIHTAIIPISKINEKYMNHVKLYFEWENLEENNESDSQLGETADAKISIPIEINLKQYTGEGIGDETK